ncbi:MAG TPA: hypothetical protein VHZ55_25685 [Bryobacteraceae bacterium]|jgi:flagellar export protein FliJ|nr:hypothetical protein [Bryobacteraceae bacterium]
MTKFIFRLDTALRLRQLKSEAEKAKLQEQINQKRRFEKSLAGLREERVEASTSIQASAAPGIGDLRALSAFTLGLEARAKTLREAIARTELQISEQRKRVLRAEQDALALSKLRLKRRSEWALEMEREIENTSQELWLCSHTKNKEDPKNDYDLG